MIRYDIGDSGQLLDGECDCGLPFPLMEMDLCRQNDLIRTPSGKTVHPSYFNRLLYGQTQIRQYQWVQRDLNRLELNLVAPPLGSETLASLEAGIRRDVDARMALNVNYLDDIPRTVSGKHRFVIGIDEQQAVSKPRGEMTIFNIIADTNLSDFFTLWRDKKTNGV